ncbi:MAG: SRPBCC family protein [Actinobacteria bacterium]|nr:SRPBCC family protein [Actinomycetota bacterium]
MRATPLIALSGVAWALVATAGLLVAGVASLVFLMTRGWLTLDLGWGRSHHQVGPLEVTIDAPRDLVFEQLSSPYVGRTPAAMRGGLEVLERGRDLVVALHRTRLRLLDSITVEAIGFEPPERIRFRHVRGPVPHAVEEFRLTEEGGSTRLEYRGELGIDFWWLGRLAGRHWVVPNWQRIVQAAMEKTKAGAESRQEARRRRRPEGDGRDR